MTPAPGAPMTRSAPAASLGEPTNGGATPAPGAPMTRSAPAASLGEPTDGGATPATGGRTTESARGRLAELAASLGELSGGGDALLRVVGEDVAWFVEQGGIDVFLVEYRGGAVVSSFKHLLRAGPGRLVFGVGKADGEETVGGEATGGEAAGGEAAARRRTARRRMAK